MRKLHVAPLVAALFSLLAMGGPAHALVEDVEPEPDGVVAQYRGVEINLLDGWQDASICIEVDLGDARCYDSVEEADRDLSLYDLNEGTDREIPEGDISIAASSDCPWGWVCLWEYKNYSSSGRLLMWSQPGTKNLGDWNFRDKASSACVARNQGGVEVHDWRTLMPDPWMVLGAGYCYNDFSKISYPYGGNWDNRADSIKM
ncbi:peptidase inhibitor family I36 protein [Streptomyces xiamenensis]